MLLANALTLLRVLLIWPLLIAIFGSAASGGHPGLAMGLFLAGAATDALDGYVARKSGATSRFGQIADPVADKLFGTAALAAVALQNNWGLWLPALLAAKELLLLVGGLWLWRRHNRVAAARPSGKAATFLLFTGLALALGGVPGALVIVSAGVAISLLAGIDYARLAVSRK